MLIIYFFQVVLNTCEMWSNGIKIAFFSKKFQKIAQRLGVFVPRSPSVIRLNKLIYLHKSPILDIFICNFYFKPSSFRKLSVKCQTRPRLLIFHSTISLSNKNSSFENFWWLHCMWFLVWPPQPKILATPMHWRWHFEPCPSQRWAQRRCSVAALPAPLFF